MNQDVLKNQTKELARQCVKLAFSLSTGFWGNYIKKQFLRSGTSSSANYRAVRLELRSKLLPLNLALISEEADESEF